MERALRGIAGFVVLLGIILGHYVHPGYYWIDVFVGLNLIQSSFTNWCPMMWILKKIGVK